MRIPGVEVFVEPVREYRLVLVLVLVLRGPGNFDLKVKRIEKLCRTGRAAQRGMSRQSAWPSGSD